MLVQHSSRAFAGASVLLFAASAVLTVAACRAMDAMPGMSMPGGWTMSMMWMRMPGQSWPGAAGAFLGMWLAMMVAMMLPSLLPMLWRYRRAAAGLPAARVEVLAIVIGSGYFFVWAVFGVAAFVAGTVFAGLVMQSPPLARAVPLATAAIVTAAGVLQFSAWKARHLACCRPHDCRLALPAGAAGAWRHGIRLGVHCVHCCFGLTAILLVVGTMNLGAMALATAAISAERLAPGGTRAARLTGFALIVGGLCAIARAAVA